MVRSMTGFGRAVTEAEGYLITVELKSVNHRYFEFSLKCPRPYGFLENKIKAHVNAKIARGKIECFVGIEALNTGSADVAVDHTLAAAYVKALKELSAVYALKEDFSASVLSRFPDVLVVRKGEEDEAFLWSCVKAAADEALDQLTAMRLTEGARLGGDIAARAKTILDCVAFIEERSPETVREYHNKLISRMNELLENAAVDESRILQEAAVFADRIAVEEETVRLRSHIAQLSELLESREPAGRKMDFLVQEINREANTIGSKANDVTIAKKVVAMKAEIEKIREQIQNIE